MANRHELTIDPPRCDCGTADSMRLRRSPVASIVGLVLASVLIGGCAGTKKQAASVRREANQPSSPIAASVPATTAADARQASLPAVPTAVEGAAVTLLSAAESATSKVVHAGGSAGAKAETVPPPLPHLNGSGDDAKAVAEAASPFPNPSPIDLGTALHITAGDNPRVAFAQERVREAYAQLQAANVLWLPSLRAGMNYNKHEGVIQDVAGNFFNTSRGSLYTGLGASAVGAASPAVPGIYMNFHLRDAVFNPRIAERTLAAQRRAGQAATNDVLLETSLAYLDLLEAAQTKAIADDTLAHAAQLAELTKSFAEAGQGLEADADRSKTELAARQVEAARAVENVRVASARLSRLLSRDQSLTLLPDEPAIAPIEMVDIEPGLADLVAIGLTNRPELAESQLLVSAAVERLRREQAAPLIPSVLLGTSYGGNGGGLGSDFKNFNDRFDADLAAYWEVRNLGLGEQAQRCAAQSRMQQAVFQRVQMMDQVAAEVAEAYAQVEVRRGQIAVAEAGIQSADDSFRRNRERIQQGQGLPIETLQSIQALDQARRLYVRAVADYNRAQFRLHRALGWPVLSAGDAHARH